MTTRHAMMVPENATMSAHRHLQRWRPRAVSARARHDTFPIRMQQGSSLQGSSPSSASPSLGTFWQHPMHQHAATQASKMVHEMKSPWEPSIHPTQQGASTGSLHIGPTSNVSGGAADGGHDEGGDNGDGLAVASGRDRRKPAIERGPIALRKRSRAELCLDGITHQRRSKIDR